MQGPMVLLGLICLWVGLFPATMVYCALQGAETITGRVVSFAFKENIVYPLLLATRALSFGMIIFVVLALLRKFLALDYPIRLTETWCCGYTKFSSRVQYTASSFAKPILKIFRSVLFYKVEALRPKGYFPTEGKLRSSVKDASESLLFRPLFYVIKIFSRKLKWIQGGHTQIYILYILFLLVVLLVWKLH
jgi:hypothetical protein